MIGNQLIVFRPAWYWRVFSIVDILLSVLFLLQAQRIEFPSREANWVFFTCGALALFFGVASWIYLKSYSIVLDGHLLRLKYTGIKERQYDLTQLVEVRKRGFYITLDYGKIPRIAILAIAENNTALFNAISRATFARR